MSSIFFFLFGIAFPLLLVFFAHYYFGAGRQKINQYPNHFLYRLFLSLDKLSEDFLHSTQSKRVDNRKTNEESSQTIWSLHSLLGDNDLVNFSDSKYVSFDFNVKGSNQDIEKLLHRSYSFKLFFYFSVFLLVIGVVYFIQKSIVTWLGREVTFILSMVSVFLIFITTFFYVVIPVLKKPINFFNDEHQDFDLCGLTLPNLTHILITPKMILVESPWSNTVIEMKLDPQFFSEIDEARVGIYVKTKNGRSWIFRYPDYLCEKLFTKAELGDLSIKLNKEIDKINDSVLN